ncbi:hypothetical protein Misp06_03057 [Microbulbifer sp. NBRC 101763]|uniref:hypothetical protein n=2 Tax=Microbulbifer TaxID=48073 RepID=UPI00309EFC21
MNRFAIFSDTYNLMMDGAKDFIESHPTKEAAQARVKEVASSEPFIYWLQVFDKATDTLTTYRVVNGEAREDRGE